MKLRIKGYDLVIIGCYATNEDSKDSAKDDYYGNLELHIFNYCFNIK